MVGRTYVYEDVCDMPLLIRSRQNYTQRWRDREIKQQQGISINICPPDHREERHWGEEDMEDERQNKRERRRGDSGTVEDMRGEERRNQDS